MFEINHNDQSFRIKMSATLENIDTADDKLAEYLTDRKIPVDVFALRIILRESLLNAVTHGSGVNPEENVSFDLNIDNSRVTVKVSSFSSRVSPRMVTGTVMLVVPGANCGDPPAGK